jgi:hypothetical protein
LAVFITLCLLSVGWVPVHAQTTQDPRYFSETGHNVKGDFLKFYNSNPNATFLYGYPITEEFTSKDEMYADADSARGEKWQGSTGVK